MSSVRTGVECFWSFMDMRDFLKMKGLEPKKPITIDSIIENMSRREPCEGFPEVREFKENLFADFFDVRGDSIIEEVELTNVKPERGGKNTNLHIPFHRFPWHTHGKTIDRIDIRYQGRIVSTIERVNLAINPADILNICLNIY